ncbi:hypothetical protein BDN72DRAFT_906405 [Pluteus cervinus]|uniref:Uncharacterized protein n=1 Tax=Pluteus cervinus TaxID=181527 RepID=A0ACD2ZZD4_9AGAR|nr:hypothetical protein BDN72DRAFT_906405 [Pluteus cervinus]
MNNSAPVKRNWAGPALHSPSAPPPLSSPPASEPARVYSHHSTLPDPSLKQLSPQQHPPRHRLRTVLLVASVFVLAHQPSRPHVVSRPFVIGSPFPAQPFLLTTSTAQWPSQDRVDISPSLSPTSPHHTKFTTTIFASTTRSLTSPATTAPGQQQLC